MTAITAAVTADIVHVPMLSVRVAGNEPVLFAPDELRYVVELVQSNIDDDDKHRRPGVAYYACNSSVYTLWNDGRLILCCADADITFDNDERALAFVQAVTARLGDEGGAR